MGPAEASKEWRRGWRWEEAGRAGEPGQKLVSLSSEEYGGGGPPGGDGAEPSGEAEPGGWRLSGVAAGAKLDGRASLTVPARSPAPQRPRRDAGMSLARRPLSQRPRQGPQRPGN